MPTSTLTSGAIPAKPRWLAVAKLGVRLAVFGLIAGCVWYTVEKALAGLRQERFSLAELAGLDYRWLAAAAALYLAALALSCWYWDKVLRAMGQRPQRRDVVRAYFVGSLGKYVPGKAMVVILRAGMVRRKTVDTTAAAVSVFVETLTLMAVGAGFASALLAALYREHVGLLLLGGALTMGAGVPTLPPIFRRLVMLLQVKRLNPEIERDLAGLDWRLMLSGWILMGLSWCLMAMSLWAVIKSIPGATMDVNHLPLVGATVALAMVAGFVSFIPGGFGVREVVVIPLLAPVFGNVVAIVSAVLLRIVWLAVEVAIAGIVYLVPRTPAELPDAHPE